MPRNKTTIKTNSNMGSEKTILLKPVTFDELWDAYPSSAVKHIDKKTSKDVVSDHCAVNLSEALIKCGISIKVKQEERCWCCPSPDSKGHGVHFLRAKELSAYLSETASLFVGFPKYLELSGSDFVDKIDGKTGIIYFHSYWLRSGQTSNPTGDHIDLWNGKIMNRLAGSTPLGSFFRLNMPESTEYITNLFGDSYRVTDLRKAKKILFWEIL